MEETFKEYIRLASKNEDLKSDERILTSALANLKEIKTLLVDKEKEFCKQDQALRSLSNQMDPKASLTERCLGLINHIVHYKCVIECMSGDILSMESNLIDDDEYIHLSLIFREAELAILQAVKTNQQRSEVFQDLNLEEAHSYQAEVEERWRLEHDERRKLINRLLLDQNQVIIDKITSNLEKQQTLLNQRYLSINNLIKMSYTHLERDKENREQLSYTASRLQRLVQTNQSLCVQKPGYQ